MSGTIRRREFITLLGGAAGAWPLAARAQPASRPVIGFLGSLSAQLWSRPLRAFHQGLGESGFVEGRNVMEYRWAEGQNNRLPALAADLVRRQVDVIAAPGGVAVAQAAKAATATIPIVFMFGADPVETGLLASLNRPGGNITGVTTLGGEVAPKRLEVMRELLPASKSMALLANPANLQTATLAKELRSAANRLGLELRVVNAATKSELEKVFENWLDLGASAMVIANDGFFTSQIELLAALAARCAVPAIYHYREFAAAGGLMSYGASLDDPYRLAGVYTGRILKGDKPTDLPVQQAAKVELVINLKTARALGLEVPPTLLVRADEVIE